MRPYLRHVLVLAGLTAATLTLGRDLAAQAGVRERTLYVSAVDKNGEPVDGLGPEAFVVREGGRRREILRVSRATEPIDLAVLVDNSASSDSEYTFMRDAVSKFVTAMGSQHRIALVGLAERPTALVQYTSDLAQLTDAIGRLFPIGGSGMTLLDGIYETSQGLRRRDGPRAIIVPVVTDGVEFTNRYSRDVVRELKQSGTALHGVGLGRFPYSDEHSIRERSFLIDEAPRATGGQWIMLLAPHALTATMERLARELSNQYKVVYGRPDSLYEGDVEVGSGRPGVTMRATPERTRTGATK